MTLHTFNRQVREVATELVDQEVAKFNEASGSTLLLGNGSVIGDYIEQASWATINGLAQRRNAYGTGKVAPQKLGQLLNRSIKVDGRIGPIEMTDTQYRRIGSNPEEVAAIISAQAAQAMIQDYLNTVAKMLKTAIGTVPELVHNAASVAGVPLSLQVLNSGNAKMGDRSSLITAYLMHSIGQHELIGQAIDNENRLYSIGNINVVDGGLGRRYVVSDIPDLVDGGAIHTLGLVPGAAAVQVSGLHSFVTTEKTGDENISRTMQGEYEFIASLKGFGWNTTDENSPSDEQIGNADNWTKTATSHKDCAGILITTGKTASKSKKVDGGE